MINNFMCDKCSHYQVCEKMKHLMKFHDSAKKDLLITITMDECFDYEMNNQDEDDESGEEDDNE